MIHELLYGPWPWYYTGPAIGLVYFALYFVGKRFGVSGTLKTTCSIIGAGKISDYFKYNWRSDIWNLVFVLGIMIGGFLGGVVFPNEVPVELSSSTVAALDSYGLTSYTETMIPSELFTWEALFSLNGLIFIVIGGMLVGFGARYADGCTSGHAITGLANLEPSSLVAVIGFFIGGMIVTYLVIPFLFT